MEHCSCRAFTLHSYICITLTGELCALNSVWIWHVPYCLRRFLKTNSLNYQSDNQTPQWLKGDKKC